MRIILKNSFFSVVCFLTVLFFGMSCQRENGPVEQEPGSPVALESGEAALSFRVSTPVVVDNTKSVITDTYFETGIRSILILVLGEDGSWKSTYKEASSGYLSTGTGVAALELDAVRVRACYQDYTVYAFVNMGNVMDNMPVDASGKPTPDAYVYSLPVAYPDLGTRGMPMCAKETVDTDDLPAGGQANVVLTLRRLMAKVVISVNKTGMTGENAGVLNSSIIRVRQVPRVIRPFASGGSGALEVAELYGGVGASYTDTDYYSFSAGAAAGAAYHTNVTTLYVPENYQGVGSETNQEKKATAPGETPTGRQALATFLEYKASKSGTNDGISGNLTYKAYLGENVVNDYNVIGDKVYRATLNLSWNGLFYDGDWRVDNSDITDGRILTLSKETPHTTSSSFTDWGRLRRNVASQLYVNFSRDGGASWVHSAKDIDGWPYGWDLYIDGVKQAAGGSATAAGDLGWSYIGDPSRDQLFITPGPSSVASSVHTLQVKSADGRVVSNEVSFEVSSSLTLAWDTVSPEYVAQRGRLYPTDLEDPSATVVYTITSGNTKVRLNSATDAQSTMVGLLAEGTATIHAECAATDQSGDMVINIVAPTLDWGGPLSLYAHPDGGDSCDGEDGMSGHRPLPAYYKPGEYSTAFVRKVGSVTTLAVNYNLASDLYDELLAFTPSVTSPLLKVSSEGYGDIILYVDKLTSGTTSYPLKQEEEIGELIVSPKSASTGVESISATVYSVDPFSAYDSYRASPVSVDKSRDINDLSVINSSDLTSARTAWSIANTTYNVSFPAISGGNSYKGLEVFLNGSSTSTSTIKSQMTGTPGGTVSWPSMVTNRLSEDTAGVIELKGFVKNRYSSEKIYSPTFYKGRLFRHGAVVAYVSNPLDSYSTHAPWTTNDMRVSCRYFGKVSGYTSSGLAFAFPDVGTHRTNETYYIQWSDYVHDMYGYRGACKVKRNGALRPVTDVNQYNEGVGYLFDVEDICGTASSYDVDIHGPSLNPHDAHEGYFCGDSSISGNTGKDGVGDKGAMMYFLPRSSQYPKYGSIRVANEGLVFIKPDGSPTHNYSSTVTGCGYFVLHTFDGNGLIEDRWL